MGLAEFKLDDVANGILVIIVGLLSYLGIRGGRKAKADDEAPAKPLEIAGALIDSRKADQLIDALDRNTEAMNRHGKQLDDVGENVREAGHEIRSMTKEIIRASK